MGHFLSKGVRVYEHREYDQYVDVERNAYNFYHGMAEVEDLMLNPSARLIGVGSEGGAMVVHFRWLH
jgi:hypothetical protein